MLKIIKKDEWKRIIFYSTSFVCTIKRIKSWEFMRAMSYKK